MRQTLGLAFAAGLFGVLFGVAAVANGLSVATALAISATVFAGAAQFATLALWQAPLPLVAIGLTTALVNARHVLMGIRLEPIARTAPRLQRWLGIGVLTDINWALTVTGPPENQRFAYFVGGGLCLWACWVTGTALGVVVPDLLPERVRQAAAMAGTLFVAAIAAMLIKSVGSRPAALPAAAAVSAAIVADFWWGAAAAPLAAVAGGALVLGARHRRR